MKSPRSFNETMNSLIKYQNTYDGRKKKTQSNKEKKQTFKE